MKPISRRKILRTGDMPDRGSLNVKTMVSDEPNLQRDEWWK